MAANLERLVRAHTLPPLVIPLRDELSHEMAMLGVGGQEPANGHDDDGDDADANGATAAQGDLLQFVDLDDDCLCMPALKVKS